ncbi:RNA polymerase sigma factor [Clostridium sp. JN-9]|uniref:RNA polymerase sigma factor n=1 Tax=Clostridium sp. JN-9 TaxID=2507159 RepID=UPI000FFDFB72|nr:RNA polymerase sigma factor [Clostridium sp. JN-9]QAT40975.1 sigma-70 family RNA polymerase sigma factor [Clostridium sp. JN-9]
MEDKMDAFMIPKSIKEGNIQVLLVWIDINKQKFYRMSWAYLKNNTDVEDAFHNTIIKVFENINKLKNEQAFEGWFISILLNECRKILRDKRRVQPSQYIEFGNTVCGLEDSAESLDLMDGLNNIHEEYRELIILKYYSGYSQKEIAEILNMPLGTVKTKIYRGLKMLRDILGRED